MKKILFAAVAALTICVSAYTYYQQSNSVALNNLALANVEALAQGESSSSYWCCGSSGTCSYNWGTGAYYSGTFRVAPC